VDEGRQSCCFGKKFPGEKGSVRQCGVVMQQPILLSPKFGEKSSHILMQLLQNLTTVCEIDCLACQDEFFVNDPLDVKENDEHAHGFALHISHLFQSAMHRACHSNTCVWLTGSSPNACLIIVRVSVILLKI
jgi:hypothetical protein